MKIISLVPSITKSLLDIGFPKEQLLGRTKFCIHPKDSVGQIPIIGGTKNLQIEKIKSLGADLIIANKEENEKAQVEELMNHFPVWLTEVKTLQDNFQFLQELLLKSKVQTDAKALQEKILDKIQKYKVAEEKKAAYLIWKKPWMSVGGDTFIHEMLTAHGLYNIFSEEKRYPQINLQDLASAEVILLSSEPYPFGEKEVTALQKIFPDKVISLVNGEYFSWFGTHPAFSEPQWLI